WAQREAFLQRAADGDHHEVGAFARAAEVVAVLSQVLPCVGGSQCLSSAAVLGVFVGLWHVTDRERVFAWCGGLLVGLRRTGRCQEQLTNERQKKSKRAFSTKHAYPPAAFDRRTAASW